MRILTTRSFLTGVFMILSPAFSFGDHDNVLKEIDNSLVIIGLTTRLAAVSFVLLVIFRNKYFGSASLIAGILMILAASGKVTAYLLTDVIAQRYVMLGFMQIAFSVIFGWIYTKKARIAREAIASTDERPAVLVNKRTAVLNVVLIDCILMAIYDLPGQAETSPQFYLTHIVSLSFLSVLTYLFITNKRSGWLMAAAFLISIILPGISSQISTLVLSQKYPGIFSVTTTIFNAMYIVCLVICLFLIFSRVVRNQFKIERKQVIFSLVLGLALSFLRIYLSIQATDRAFKSRYDEKNYYEADSVASTQQDF